MSIGLIVLLGNPGSEYHGTRHNVARQLLPFLARDAGVFREKFGARYTELFLGSSKVLLAEPLCYMNETGQPVSRIAAFYKIPPADILAVHDELELPLGRISLKIGGGTAGHKGLKSIANLIGSKDFARLRIGIGRPRRGTVSSFVLGRLTSDEQQILSDILPDAADTATAYFGNRSHILRSFGKTSN